MTSEEAIEKLKSLCRSADRVEIEAIAMAIEALKKQIPQKLKPFLYCASCGADVLGSGYYCWQCGQKIDWSCE